MIFLKIDDEYFYSKEGKEEIIKKYNLQGHRLVFAKNKEVILSAFEDGTIDNIVFYAPYLPVKLDPIFEGVFDLIRVENKYGLLTKKQHESGIEAIQIMKEKLGANIYLPTLTFKNYVIDKSTEVFANLMRNLRILKARQEFGMTTRGFFLTGVPGTGKTFFAKCVAGELNRMLIELNLSVFINADDTFGMLEKFFSFFRHNEGEYVLLIDEIEKMFNGSGKAQQVLGYLLTTLNEFHDKSRGNKADVLFIATANNVSDLSKKNPELFRKGRFDLSIYLKSPNEEKAKETFGIYVEKYRKIFEKEAIPMFFYVAAKDQNNEIYRLPEKARIFNIVKSIRDNKELLDYIVQEFNSDTTIKKDLFWDKINANELVIKHIEYIKNEFLFKLEIGMIVSNAFAQYRQLLKTDRVLFPYVPAEIEAITAEFFNEFYFSDNQNINENNHIRLYISENVPLIVSMSGGILEMDGATRNFVAM